MATDVLLVREGTKLAAYEPISAEAIEGIRQGECVKAVITRLRNPGHHRKFFALLNVVFENQTRYATLGQLLNAVKIGTGYYDTQQVKIGRIEVQVFVPRSISFGKMDQDAFEQFYDKAVEHVLAEILPGIDKTALENQVLEILA